jgi:hypothetical protein
MTKNVVKESEAPGSPRTQIQAWHAPAIVRLGVATVSRFSDTASNVSSLLEESVMWRELEHPRPEGLMNRRGLAANPFRKALVSQRGEQPAGFLVVRISELPK